MKGFRRAQLRGSEELSRAKKLLEKLAKEHKGTPYEILSKREALTTLGLEWQPLSKR